MQVYFVYDGWDEVSVWETKFYANKADAEAELERRLVLIHEQAEADYQRSFKDWQIKNTAVQAVIAAGLPVPGELAWVGSTPPEKRIFINSGLEVDYVEVIESEG